MPTPEQAQAELRRRAAAAELERRQIPETPVQPTRMIGEEIGEVRTAAEMVRAGDMPEPETRPHLPQLMGRLPGGFGALRRDLPRETGEPQYITRLREIRKGPGTEEEKDVASKLVTKTQIDERAGQIQRAVQAPHDQEAFQADAQELKGKFLKKTYRRWERGSAMVVGGGLHLAEEILRVKTLGKYGDTAAEYAKMYHDVLKEPAMQPVIENAFDKYFGGAVETGPFLGTALAPAALTGGAAIPSLIAGFLTSYAVEGNNAYQTALDNGDPEPLARIRGIAVGIINGGIEVTGGSGGKYFKHSKATAKAVATKLARAKTFSRSVLKNALKEGLLEELPQEAVSMVVGGDIPKKEDGSVDYDAVSERLTDAAVMGTILGGLVDAPISAVNIRRRVKQFIPPERVEPSEVPTDIPPGDIQVAPPSVSVEEDVIQADNERIGREYGLDSEEVTNRLTEAESRFQELGQKETTERTVDERREFRFLAENRNNLDAIIDWETAEDKTAVGKQKRKPIKSQYIAGHEIPKVLGMSEKERRTFMEKETGITSMAKMSPLEAQDYIDALHKLAKEKGVDTGILPSERRFKEPITELTPQLYKAKILGVEFMVSPAAIGKQRFDLEVTKSFKRLDVMKRIIERLGGETVKTKAAAKLKNKPTKSIVRFAELLNKYEEAPANLTKADKAVFNYFRNLSRTLLAKENAARKEIGMEPIVYKVGYMRHIVDVMAEDIIDGRHPMPEELKYWAEKNASKKITNPMEYQRKLGDELGEIFSNDLIIATKAMMFTGLKEIHLNKPLKFFETQLALHSEVIPASTRRWTEDFINHMIVGKQTNTDARLNKMVKDSGIGKVVNKVLKPFGRKISNRPYTNMMGKLGRLQIYGVMGLRPKQIIRNKFQLLQNLAFYTIKANLKSALPANKQLKKFLSESLFFETYRDQGFEDLSEHGKGLLGRAWMKGFQWSAVSNAKTAMKAAYHDTLELIEDSKHKDLGWADPKRTYKEESGFLYPSEKTKIQTEMDFGAGCAQYHYIPMAMPGVFKYKTATPITRLQSWWMNHFFKFHRESANRFFTGETREGLKLPWSRRIGWGRYLVIGGVVLNTLGYGSSYLFGAAPEAMPPLGQLLIGLYRYLVTDDDRTRNQAKWRMLSALKTFIPGYLAHRDIKAYWENKGDLKQLLFYNKGIFKEEELTKRRAPRPPVRKRPG